MPIRADLTTAPSLIAALKHRQFDLLTSNPPYISRSNYLKLPPSVKDYEDPLALLGDPPDTDEHRGLYFYKCIARLVGQQSIVRDGGLVVLEVGEGQAHDVKQIMITDGHVKKTDIWLDPWGKERVVLAWK